MMEWVTVVQCNYTTTEILNMGHTCLARVLCYNYNGDIVYCSITEIDRISGTDSIQTALEKIEEVEG